jgi:hypothetical protein
MLSDYSLGLFLSVGNPHIASSVEIQHEPITWAWSGKTTEGKASPTDCHNIAEILPDEDAL